jgi:hypothetical protein
MEKAREKAKKACEAYIQQIGTANIVHNQCVLARFLPCRLFIRRTLRFPRYYSKDLPSVLEKMQSLEGLPTIVRLLADTGACVLIARVLLLLPAFARDASAPPLDRSGSVRRRAGEIHAVHGGRLRCVD